MTPRGAATLAAALNLCTDLARDVPELNQNLKANRAAIDHLGEERPDLWAALKQRTQARRAALQAPSEPSMPEHPITYIVHFTRAHPHIGPRSPQHPGPVSGTIRLPHYSPSDARQAAAFILDEHCTIGRVEPAPQARKAP